ncbi:MAG: helix-turn-helix domain-containing protein [Clostridia bacterium]|nr:helix-turn-helix domain-containing protein [Clostridia bacterium]
MDNQCGKIIRLLREHRELTQTELAKQLSVSRELVSKTVGH